MRQTPSVLDRAVPRWNNEEPRTLGDVAHMTEYGEKRVVPRFTFSATVDISHPESGIHLTGRISEISRKGCYIDVLNTLPKDTPVQLRITRDRGTFDTAGSVIYVLERMGMGIAFSEIAPDQMGILDSWLAEFSG
jgi:PilZ domain